MVTKIIDNDKEFIKHVPDLGYRPKAEHGDAEVAPHLKEQPHNVDKTSIVGEMIDRIFKLDRLDKIIGDNKLKEEDETDNLENDYDELEDDEDDYELEVDDEEEPEEDLDFEDSDIQDDIEIEWDENTTPEDIIGDEEIIKEFITIVSPKTEDIKESKYIDEKNDAILDDDDPDNDHFPPEKENGKGKPKKKKMDGQFDSYGLDLEKEEEKE